MVKVKIKYPDNLKFEHKVKLEKAAEIVERVWNSEEFKQRILDFRMVYTTGALWWKQTRVSYRFAQYVPNVYTPEFVYHDLMDGSESLSPDNDHEIDIELKLEEVRVVGYTYPHVPWQVLGWWVLRTWEPHEIAGNLAHEYCHKKGYDHSFRRSALWPLTVPYFVGNLVEELGEKL